MSRALSLLAAAAALSASCVCALRTSNPAYFVLPPPREISVAGPPRALAADLVVSVLGGNTSSSLLADAIARHVAPWRAAALARDASAPASAGLPVRALEIAVRSPSERLDASTDYSYELAIAAEDATARVSAATVFGAMYALTSLRQLVAGAAATLPAAALRIADAPQWAHRGVMLDAGRRFFPVPLVENIIDTMALAKLNLLHLHASDECRFGIESKLFPGLTANLTGILGGFYTQADIRALVAYATARGVRIMLEVDVPGHSRGLLPLQQYGAVFCDPADATCSQLYGDPANKTYDVLTQLFSEIVPLFPEPVVHIGADETGVVGSCTTASTFQVERYVLDFLQNTLGKTPAGWEEVLFDASAATPQTVVYAWSRHDPLSIVSRGYAAVDNNASHFYLTQPGGAMPQGWNNFYYDIGAGMTPAQQALMQGGEVSQWTDTWCYIDQCGASNGAVPVGAPLFPPSMDAAFGTSVGGMIFPRTLVAATSFWNYNASTDSQEPAFVAAVWSLNDEIIAGGGLTCPTNCSCDQLTQCGEPIVPVPPPAPGMSLVTAPCVLPTPPTQAFRLLPGSGVLASAFGNGSVLCVANTAGGSGNPTYPLHLESCGSAAVVAWAHGDASSAGTARLVDRASGGCMDLSASADAYVGIYDCGSDDGLVQLNQAWAVDGQLAAPAAAGAVLTFKTGECLTAVSA